MREIKFRLWLPKINEMLYDEEVDTDKFKRLKELSNYDYPFEGDEFYPWHSVFHWLLLESDSEYMIPLQYTGLKDKNRREIYEGDIIKHVSDIKKDIIIGPVIFKKGCFAIKTKYGDKYLHTGINEVIGNIYENPELLENK